MAKQYPTLAAMVRYTLPLLTKNSLIRKSFEQVTGFTDAQFNEMVSYGTGPNIIDADPKYADYLHQDDPHGKRSSQFLGTDEYKDNIYISANELQDLEDAAKNLMKKGSGINNLRSEIFKIALLIIHESTHRGVFFKGTPYSKKVDADPEDDAGSYWEYVAFGQRFSHNPNNVSDAINNGQLHSYLNGHPNVFFGWGMIPLLGVSVDDSKMRPPHRPADSPPNNFILPPVPGYH